MSPETPTAASPKAKSRPRLPADPPAPRGKPAKPRLCKTPERHVIDGLAARAASRVRSATEAPGILAAAPPEGPRPAKKPMRFERGELPVFVLSLLADYGPLRRPAITEAAFTHKPSKLNKQRINGTIATLLEKGYADQLGTMRLYTYKITKEGKAYLRAEMKEALKA